MARAAGRSQRQPSQSQPRNVPGPSQSQRSRRARIEEDEEDVDEEREQENGMEEDEEDGGAVDEMDRRAHDLVRLALFHEHKRIPLRRDEISKKVMGSKSRAFNDVFARAQDTLRKTFGMEMVELHTRIDTEEDPDKKEKVAMGVKKKATSSGTKTYILRSTLEPALIELAAAPDAELLKVEQTERIVNADDDDSDDENTVGTRSTGSLFAWNTSDELGSVSILHVVLALILVNGRTMSDNDLRAILKRLRLTSNSTVPMSNQSTHHSLTTDAYLTQLIRQGYLDRQRIGEVKGAAGKKRGRAPTATQAQGGDDNANIWEWKWGPRSMSEVGEVGIAKFVAEFMVRRKRGGEDEDSGDEGTNDTDFKKQLTIMMKGVERAAAGGKLMDITDK